MEIDFCVIGLVELSTTFWRLVWIFMPLVLGLRDLGSKLGSGGMEKLRMFWVVKVIWDMFSERENKILRSGF